MVFENPESDKQQKQKLAFNRKKTGGGPGSSRNPPDDGQMGETSFWTNVIAQFKKKKGGEEGKDRKKRERTYVINIHDYTEQSQLVGQEGQRPKLESQERRGEEEGREEGRGGERKPCSGLAWSLVPAAAEPPLMQSCFAFRQLQVLFLLKSGVFRGHVGHVISENLCEDLSGHHAFSILTDCFACLE